MSKVRKKKPPGASEGEDNTITETKPPSTYAFIETKKKENEEETIAITNKRNDSPQPDFEKTLTLSKVETHTTTTPPASDLISTSSGDSLRGEDKQMAAGTAVLIQRFRIEFPAKADGIDGISDFTKAILILARLKNMDQSIQFLPYDESEESLYPPLGKAHEIPADDSKIMRAYIRFAASSVSRKRAEFYVRISGVKSLGMMKRQRHHMEWLKEKRCWMEVTTLQTTDNGMLGFFQGKAERFTDTSKFAAIIRDTITGLERNAGTIVPTFQLRCDQVGYQTPYLTRGIVLTCAKNDMYSLRVLLEDAYPPTSNFPFITFRTIEGSSTEVKVKIFRQHKLRIHGDNVLASSMGSFRDLDKVGHNSSQTLRSFAMTLTDENGRHIPLDIDNGGASADIVVITQSSQHSQVQSQLQKWTNNHLHCSIEWGDLPSTRFNNFSLDDNSKSTIQRFAKAASDYNITDLAAFPSQSTRASTTSTTTSSVWNNAPRSISKATSPILKTTTTMSDVQELRDNIKTLWKNQFSIRCHLGQIDATANSDKIDFLENEYHLFSVSKGIQRHMINLRTDRSRQAKINHLQGMVNLDPDKCHTDGTLDALNSLLDEDWEAFRAPAPSFTVNPDEPTEMTRVNESMRKACQMKKEAYEKLIRADPPGRLIEFSFDSNSDDYSILTGSTHIDHEGETDDTTIKTPEVSEHAIRMEIDLTHSPPVHQQRTDPPDKNSPYITFQPKLTPVETAHISPTLHELPNVRGEATRALVSLSGKTTPVTPFTTAASGPKGTPLVPRPVPISDSRSEEWSIPSKRAHKSRSSVIKPMSSVVLTDTPDGDRHPSTPPRPQRKHGGGGGSGQESGYYLQSNRYAVLDPDKPDSYLHTRTYPLSKLTSRPEKWYSEDDSSNDEDSSSAYTDHKPENHSGSDDDHMSPSDFDEHAVEVNYDDMEADEGYDTDTTSNCKKRPMDPPGSPPNSTPEFLDLTLDTPAIPRTTKNSSSTPYGYHHRQRRSTTIYKRPPTKTKGISQSASSQSSVYNSRQLPVVRKSRRHKHNASTPKNSIAKYSFNKSNPDTASDSSFATVTADIQRQYKAAFLKEVTDLMEHPPKKNPSSHHSGDTSQESGQIFFSLLSNTQDITLSPTPLSTPSAASTSDLTSSDIAQYNSKRGDPEGSSG